MDAGPLPTTDRVRTMCRATIEVMDRLDQHRPQIEEAMRRGVRTHSFDDICEMVLQQKLTPRFFSDDTFVLSAVHEYPLAKHYHIFLAGGNLEVLMAARDDLIEDAKRAGCTRMTINGRPGWARIMQKIGARHTYTMLALEVPNDG